MEPLRGKACIPTELGNVGAKSRGVWKANTRGKDFTTANQISGDARSRFPGRRKKRRRADREVFAGRILRWGKTKQGPGRD